jgi:hypothetical protein
MQNMFATSKKICLALLMMVITISAQAQVKNAFPGRKTRILFLLDGSGSMLAEMGGHGGENLPKAQAIKDATMAYFISKNLPPKGVFLHYNGSYHSDNFEGIGFYLKRSNPGLRLLTIATVTQADLNALPPENLSKADFILVIDEDVVKTY